MLTRMFVGMFVLSLCMPLVMIDSLHDYRLSLNQVYGALFMSAAMILIGGHTSDMAILILMFIICIVSVLAIRYQYGIDDKMYLRDMIPHHSMAVLTSKKQAGRATPVQSLATTILDTQVREIALMKSML
jgi:hypothetical protein